MCKPIKNIPSDPVLTRPEFLSSLKSLVSSPLATNDWLTKPVTGTNEVGFAVCGCSDFEFIVLAASPEPVILPDMMFLHCMLQCVALSQCWEFNEGTDVCEKDSCELISAASLHLHVQSVNCSDSATLTSETMDCLLSASTVLCWSMCT